MVFCNCANAAPLIDPVVTFPPVKLAFPETVSKNPFKFKVPAETFNVVIVRLASSIQIFGTAPLLIFTISPAIGNPVAGVQFAFTFQADEVDPFQVYVAALVCMVNIVKNNNGKIPK